MSKCPIGVGKCSFFYLYIFGAFISDLLSDYIISLKDINKKYDYNMFKTNPVLRNHKLIRLSYKFLGMMIFSIIFIFIQKPIKIRKESMKKLDNASNSKKNPSLNKSAFKELLIIGIIFSLQSLIRKILSIFNFKKFEFWIFNFVFIIVFMKYYFKINLYKHKKYTLIFIFVSNLILLSVSNFQNSYDSIKETGKKTNGFVYIKELLGSPFYSILIYIIYIIISAGSSYSRVLSKKIMEHKYQSPYEIIVIIGIFGFIFVIISLIFTSRFECDESIKSVCRLNGRLDDFKTYFSNLKKEYFNTKRDFFIEIFLVLPLYLFLGFFQFICEFLIIFYLNPNYIIISDCLSYSIKYFLKLIYQLEDIRNNHIDFIEEIIALVAGCIYLEIIELRFCGLNKDIRANIMRRSNEINMNFDEDVLDLGDYFIKEGSSRTNSIDIEMNNAKK